MVKDRDDCFCITEILCTAAEVFVLICRYMVTEV